MSRLDLAQLKAEIVINAAMRLMLQAASHGYTFDSVELLPYEGVGEGIAYKLWVRDAQGEKVLAYQDILSMLICHGEQTKKKAEQQPQEWEEEFDKEFYEGLYSCAESDGEFYPIEEKVKQFVRQLLERYG